MPGNLDTLEYLIKISLDKQGAIAAQQELARLSTEAQAQAAKLGKAYQVTGKEFAQVSKATEEGITTTHKLTEEVKYADGTFGKVTHTVKQTADGLGQLTSETQGVTVATSTATKASQSFLAAQIKLAARAIAVIPIWMALRAVYSTVIGSISDIIQAHKDLDEGMQKVMAVVQETGDAQAKVYDMLRTKAINYYATSLANIKDITQAMYELGSAGRSAEEMAKGFKHIMDLSQGAYTDVTQVAKTVAGIMNVFGKQIEQVGDKEKQLQYITDMLADSWQKHQIEVSDISTAFSYLGSVGAATGITFEEFLAAVGNMSDVMLRGGKAGRLLASAIAEMGRNVDALADLGVIFDPYKPIKFRDIMEQLHNIYLKQGESLATNTSMIEVFGAEGARAITDILVRWEGFLKDLERTPEAIEGINKKLKETRELTLWGQFARNMRMWWTNMTQAWKPAGPKGPMSWLREGMKSAADEGERFRKQQLEILDLYTQHKDALKLSQKEADYLAIVLYNLNKVEESNVILRRMWNDEFQKDATQENLSEKEMLNILQQKLQALQKVTEEKKKQTAEDKKITGTGGVTPQEVSFAKRFPKEQKELDLIKDQSLELERQLLGYNEQEIALSKIVDWMKRYNTEERMVAGFGVNINMLLNQDVEALAKIGMSVESMKESFKLVEDYQKQILQDTLKWADALGDITTNLFADLLRGEKGLGDIFSEFAGNIKETYIQAMSEGLSDLVIGQTGIGAQFGSILSAFKGAMSGRGITGAIQKGFLYGAQITEQAIIRGFTAGSAQIAGGFGGGGGGFGGLWMGGPIGAGGGIGAVPMGGGLGRGRATYGRAGGAVGMGQMWGGLATSALTGYSMYQSARAGGASRGRAMGAGIMGGLGAGALGVGLMGGFAAPLLMGGVMQAGVAGMAATGGIWAGGMGALGGVLAAIPVWGWIALGAGLLAGSMLLGRGGKQTQTQVETSTQMKNVASRIDVTNAKLELINRNLIALRQDLTYILPQSAYFAEKRNLEDNFSLDSRRG
jgi:TP901 family phage tail tape measure protein